MPEDRSSVEQNGDGSPTGRRPFIKQGLAVSGVLTVAGCASDDGDDGDDGGQDRSTPENEEGYEPVPPLLWLQQSRGAQETHYNRSEFVAGQLEELGLEFEMDTLEWDAWVDRWFAHDHDIHSNLWSGSIERTLPYYNLYFSFHSKYAEPGDGNTIHFRSDEYDEIVDNFAQAMEPEEAQKYAYQCQAILGANQPVMWGEHPAALTVANKDAFTNWNEMLGTMAYWNVNTFRDLEPQGTDTLIKADERSPEGYPNFFDPQSTIAGRAHRMTYDTVVRLDYNGEVYPGAAEDWEIVNDTTVDITLREGMTWHDGEPVTASDLKFTWDYVTEWGIPYLASDYEMYESSEVLDELTVRFNLTNPFVGFMHVSMFRIPFVPEHVWSDVVEEEGLEHPSEWSDPDMTGSGPFKFVDFEPGNKVVMEKYEDHYWADEIAFDRLVWQEYDSAASIVGDLESGTAHFTQNVGATHFDRAREADNLKAVENENLVTFATLVKNDLDPFTDVRVRQALAHAIDDQAVINTVLQGYGMNATSTVTPANEFYHNPDTPSFEPDMDKAIEFLEEAGLRWNDEGRLMMPTDWEPEVEYISLDEIEN